MLLKVELNKFSIFSYQKTSISLYSVIDNYPIFAAKLFLKFCSKDTSI